MTFTNNPESNEPTRIDSPEYAGASEGSTLRHDVVAREKEQYGGMKFGTAFFGWLTATGTAVLLAALGAAIGLGVVQVGTQAGVDQQTASTIGLVGAIALLVIVFVAYFAGGYVAGRMARFSGAKQGIAVWLWAVIVTVVVAIVAAIAGGQSNMLGNLNSFPSIPMDQGDFTVGGIITAILIAVVSLGAAMLGGLTGMRYHRRVDKAGLGL